MIEENFLGNIECQLLWDVDGKMFSILTVICHQVVILH